MAGIPASLLDLNDDVLVTLASYLDSTSALRLSWTSRAIYLITHHLALQSVTLRSALNITKFCSYMLNDMPHRLFALRELHLRCVVLSAYELTAHVTNHTEDFYVAGAKLLSKVFREATNLRVLSMDSADMWMAYETQMISVLSSMRTLQEIELEIIGAHTSEFINTMQSAPRRLFFRKPDRQLESDRRLRLDPQLRLRSVEFLTVNDPDNSPELSDLAQAFPGVKNLIIGESRTHLRAGRRRGTTSIPTALWENLERVRCPPSSFEHWRNIVRIHLLQFIPQLSFALPDVLGGLSIGDIMHIDQIALRVGISAMRNVEPVALIIELDGNLRWEHLARLIGGSVRLRYLAVAVQDHDTSRVLDIASWQATLCSIIASSNIICLELRFFCASGAKSRFNSTAVSLSNHLNVHSYPQALIHILGTSIGRISTSLRYVSLDISPKGESPWRYDFLDPEHTAVETHHELHWWRLEGQGPARVARVLDPIQGERIAAYLRSVRYNCSVEFDERDVPNLRSDADGLDPGNP